MHDFYDLCVGPEPMIFLTFSMHFKLSAIISPTVCAYLPPPYQLILLLIFSLVNKYLLSTLYILGFVLNI